MKQLLVYMVIYVVCNCLDNYILKEFDKSQSYASLKEQINLITIFNNILFEKSY
jgi:hypothetical protein